MSEEDKDLEGENQQEQIDDVFGFESAGGENKKDESDDNADEKKEDEGTDGADSGDDKSEGDKEDKGSEDEKADGVEDKIAASGEPSELDILKEQNRLLLERVEKLSESIMVRPQVFKSEETKDEKPGDAEKKEAIADALVDVIGDLDIDEVVSDKKLFNQVIGKVISATKDATRKEIMSMLPEIIGQQTIQHLNIKELTSKFYEENEDLVPLRKTVSVVAANLYAEDPKLDPISLMSKAADRTREMLGIRKVKPSGDGKGGNGSGRKRNPEFPSGSSKKASRISGQEMDSVQKDIYDTLGI